MNEHMRVGTSTRRSARRWRTRSGLDSQDFVVAYETDDLVAFGDLSGRSRDRKPPLHGERHADPAGIHRELDEILALLGAG
jgi:hypothetical protein